MLTFTRSVHHDLPADRGREVVTATAGKLGFAPAPGAELAFRRGTWTGQLTAMNPAKLRAWLQVVVRPGEAALELRVSSFLTIIYPQDRRYYETELEALEAALLGRAADTTPAEAEREARAFSWLTIVIVLLALASGVLAKAAGWF